MISFLSGKILFKGENYAIVEVNNIGYKVFLALIFLADLKIGGEVEFYTHQYVREDALDLYGFRSMEELQIFELLISISGIGPKSALGILSIANIAEIKNSIASGDSSLLTKVSGVGRKTAERVVLELREKVGALKMSDSASDDYGSAHVDEIDALIALGYSLVQAREALRSVDKNIKDSGERIREALKGLSRK